MHPTVDAGQQPGDTSSRRIRVTEQLSAEIVRRYQAGQPSRLVAEQLGVSKSTVLKELRLHQIAVRPIGVRY
ncbi:MAG: helix-turn-helix domain-containing protein [Jatrophihabitantaceae bacterium]